MWCHRGDPILEEITQQPADVSRHDVGLEGVGGRLVSDGECEVGNPVQHHALVADGAAEIDGLIVAVELDATEQSHVKSRGCHYDIGRYMLPGGE
ncbi:Uncharacterised protein [Mycobacteroides abscessus subsp. massiliense]|nr:Uncharacterised protein [Mycobacteroides abscessus subsp. massiliense]